MFKKVIMAVAIGASCFATTFGAGAFDTGQHRNLFVEMGIATDNQVDTRVQSAYQQLFYGNPSTESVYFTYGSDMAFIKAIDSNDIRSEGMSYGMIIAVMMDDQIAFNKLWKFSKTYMQHQSGDRKFYFSWQLETSPPFNMRDPNSAPDGEEYFAMALMFAANRWGNDAGIYNYSQEANIILNEMVNKTPTTSTVAMINQTHNQIVFTPDASSEAYTDPSYHTPAFYELFARWATQDNAYWTTVAETSRNFFAKAAHPITGLYSDYAEFNGTPKVTSFNQNSHLSAFDAMRTIQNVAVDFAWFEDDYRAVELANRILGFYNQQGNYVTIYSMDGVPQVDYRMEGHTAMNAVAALAADIPAAKRFVQDLWDTSVPTGQWRYYNGLLYMMGLLHTAGDFKIYHPAEGSTAPTAFAQLVDTKQDTAVTIQLSGSDADGTISSYQRVTNPTHGVLSGSGKTLSYQPALGFSGSDSFTFTVTDNDGHVSPPATVTIKVNKVTPPGSGLSCKVQENTWPTGYTANITVTNDSAQTLEAWQVTVQLATGDAINQSWSSQITGTTGAVVVKNAAWNGRLAPGKSATFGFNASHTGLSGRKPASCQ